MSHRSSADRPGAGLPESVRPEALPDLGMTRIRSFVRLAEELHFGHAADDLYLSQPALSQQIAYLERNLGVGLFHRGRRSVSLTPSGRTLLRGCRRVIEIMDDAVTAARTEAATATAIVLSHTPESPPSFVDSLSDGLSAQLAATEVVPVRLALPEQVRLVADGGAYAGITYGDVRTNDVAVTVTTIGADPYVLLIAADHAIAGSAAPGLAELSGLRLVRPPGPGFPCWSCPAQAGRHRCPAVEVEDVEAAVATGRAGAVLPASWTGGTGHPGLRHLPLAILPPVPLAVISAGWASRVETARLIELGRAVWAELSRDELGVKERAASTV